MKKIYFTLIVAFLFTNFTFGQTLMSDEDHRLMMNTYATNLNTVLTAEMPQGMTIDQFKKKVINGELTLSSTAQASILTFAIPLKTYGGDFANAKGLTATTDSYKYFYSSFSPSTVVENGKLVESTTLAGITAREMWTCALESFSTDDCGLSALVSDKSNLNTLATASVGKLTSVTALGNMGVLVMLSGFGDCIYYSSFRNPYEYVGIEHNLFLSEFMSHIETSYLNNEWDNIGFLSDEFKTKFAIVMNDACHSYYSGSESTIYIQESIYDQLSINEWFDGDSTNSIDLARTVLNRNASDKDKEFTLNLLNDVYNAINNASSDELAYTALKNVISYHEELILSEEWNSDENYAIGAIAVTRHSTQFWENYDFSLISVARKKPNPRSSIVVGADIAGYVVGGVVGGVAGVAVGPVTLGAGTVAGVLGGKVVGAWAGSAAASTAIAIYDAWDDWYGHR